MKRQLTSILLFSALLVGGASTFVSCTDNESDSAYNTSVSLADAIAQKTKELQNLTKDLATKVDMTTYANDKKALEDRIKANKDVLDAGALKDLQKYNTLEAAIQGSKAYTDLKKQVDDHIKAVEDLRKKDAEAAKKITDALNEHLKKLDDTCTVYNKVFDYLINKKLDAITVNATENPVLGYYNASFIGSQLNMAASYYGTATAVNGKSFDVENGQFLNNKDAGKIYVTLNPTEIDPTVVSLKLVDSQGNEAKGFELGDIENTDKVLTFGYTRANTSANGFYAVPVKATDPANDDFSLNKGELKEAAKNVLAKLQNPKETNLNLSQVATTLYSSINNKLKAYGVQAKYYLYDPSTKELVEKHAMTQYNTAAFAVKPLSFNFANDNANLSKLGLALDKYLTIPTLSDKVGKYIKALDFQVKYDGAKEMNVYTILATNNFRCYQDGDDVVITDGYYDYNEETGEWTLRKNKVIEHATLQQYVNYDGKYVYADKFDENGWWIGTEHVGWAQVGETLNIITTTDTTIKDLITSLNNQISDELTPVKDAINNAADKWDNAIAPVNNLLHKVTGKIADANKLLQPTLLYKSSKTKSWNVVSTLGGKLGTRMTGEGSTVLVATSWTAELLAPAYKKSVYVKGNPAGAKVTLMDGKTPAENFSGSVQKVLFSATAKDNYTIVYKAVDYTGFETTKEYNITVE